MTPPTAPSEPHTWVTIFLRGGADALSLIPPVADDAYHRARPTLRLPASDCEPLDDIFGLHPQLNPLLPVFREGRLLVVQRTGSHDTTRSHFEAQDTMEHGGGSGGWLARCLAASPHAQQTGLASAAFAQRLPETLRGAPSVAVLNSIDQLEPSPHEHQVRRAVASLYQNDPRLAAPARAAFDAHARLSQTIKRPTPPQNGAHYPDERFASQLRDTARLIRAGVGLRAVTIDLDGWDSHVAQAPLIQSLAARLGAALAAFDRDLGDALAHVTVVVMTEFGRRVSENSGAGTDHGRAGALLALGGGVLGGRVLGGWDPLDAAPLEGPGDVPVAVDYRNVLAAVAARHEPAVAASRLFPDFPASPLNLYPAS